MDQIFPGLGPYFWWIIAGLLLIAEMLAPGFFMIWFAAAAAVTALAHIIYPQGWIGEVAIFAVLAGVAVAVSWRFVTASWATKSDQPNLNQRHNGLIGQTYPLMEPIINGRGKIDAGGTVWDVEGPDLAQGARVKVVGTDGMKLKVMAA
ncbi:NfeD family protein [Aestuariivirga litoralis]|uniref:NfeD family protein n=1 Tax=Aestuariivirga litoralis TaxID=2650924 RepID=UPI0018C51226|nr:NfeD family protein [Aestuariivirga litoralis]MBG1233145.1 NfeD family protein [Aestuariivirga litoralis]